jgi:hypothetical protein
MGPCYGLVRACRHGKGQPSGYVSYVTAHHKLLWFVCIGKNCGISERYSGLLPLHTCLCKVLVAAAICKLPALLLLLLSFLLCVYEGVLQTVRAFVIVIVYTL